MQKRAKTQQYQVIYEPGLLSAHMKVRCDDHSFGLPVQEIPYLHYHHCLEVGLCYGGDGLFLCDERAETVRSGDVILIFPPAHHYSRSIDADTHCQCRFAYFDYRGLLATLHPGTTEERRPDVAAMLGGVVHGIPPILRESEYPEAVALLRRLCAACFEDQPHRDALCALYLCEFFLRAPSWFERFYVGGEEQGAMMSLEDDAVSIATSYMSLHYTERITANALASLCHMSESQLRRRFHQRYGCSPMSYLNSLRCRIGAELLRHTDLTVAAVSDKIGYENSSDFYRHFVARYAMAPSDFRKKNTD